MECPSIAGAIKNLLFYLTGSTNAFITYKQGWVKLAAFSDANKGNSPDMAQMMPSYIVMLANGSISLEVRRQCFIAYSTMDAELVAAGLTLKEAVFCMNKIQELDSRLDSTVSPFISNTRFCFCCRNRIYSSRPKNIALRFFFI